MYKISIPRGKLDALAKFTGVSKRTVQNALSFSTEGDQPDLIRDAAIKYFGGVRNRRPIQFSIKK